jgi:hypothetical protein
MATMSTTDAIALERCVIEVEAPTAAAIGTSVRNHSTGLVTARLCRVLRSAIAWLPKHALLRRADAWLAFVAFQGRMPRRRPASVVDRLHFLQTSSGFERAARHRTQTPLSEFVQQRVGTRARVRNAQDAVSRVLYRVLCVDGKPRLVVVDQHSPRDRTRNFYTTNWQPLDVEYGHRQAPICRRPRDLEQLLSIAERLSRGATFLGIDLSVDEGQIAVIDTARLPFDLQTRFASRAGERLISTILFGD